MKVAIVDDLPADREKLQKDVDRWMKENRRESLTAPVLFENGEALLEYVRSTRGRFDIIFLDIYMAGMTGMDTARHLRAKGVDSCLIFTTETPEFAVESYDVNSSWYLLKPYSYEKLARALERCSASISEDQEMILVPGKSGEETLILHDIVYTEYERRHVQVHMKDGSCRPLAMRQADLADALLPYPFFCDCMKGVLVNLEAVDHLEKDRFLLKNGQPIPISRLKYPAVKEQYTDFSFSSLRRENL
ncbi:MAG: LytTR family DNA-binding domain-containing protein [Lachnospiraceae bacterium]|nr:LytTR family DNA-binding domain-containing protein [Lachnospiraceae bacterium]